MNEIKKIDYLLKTLFKLNRSLITPDNNKTLNLIKKEIPIKVLGSKSSEKVYDWVIPKEWLVKDAFISDLKSNKIIDFKNNNLHLLGYSHSIDRVMLFKDLKKKLHTLRKLPKAIPYRTSYYKTDWGFCVNKEQYDLLKKKKKLKVKIDTSFRNGKIAMGEFLLKGKSKKEILFTTYICHPSMANDNLSGIILNTLLAKYLKDKKKPYWSYRFVFHPETIGALAYLKKKVRDVKKNVLFGFVLSCVGGPGEFFYKKTFNEEHFLNKLVINFFKNNRIKLNVSNFDIHGSDERQYSSQGFGINMGTISKSKYYEYKEYHTSLDDLDFVKSSNILKTLNIYKKIVNEIEKTSIHESIIKNGEPMLSKRGIYPSVGGKILPKTNNLDFLSKILWILLYSNGKNSDQQIIEKLKIGRNKYKKIIQFLLKKKLIKKN